MSASSVFARWRLGSVLITPNLHRPCVLVLEADGVTIRREVPPQKVLLDSVVLPDRSQPCGFRSR